MDVRVQRTELLAELAPMQGIVERKTTIPALAHILLTARGDRVLLAATDLDVSLTSWCSGDVARSGSVAVQAKKLNEIIRALDADEVHLSEEDPHVLTIKSGSSRFRIRGMNPEDFPTLPSVGDTAATEIAFADLRRMISKVLFAVSSEESRFQLNGALVKVKESSVEMVATDGHRLALVESSAVKSSSGSVADGVLVPRKALQELQRFDGDGSLAYRRGAHHLSFQLGRRELICRILEGTFPDYERVIARDNLTQVVFDRRLLSDAVRRVALLTGDRARAIRLRFDADTLTISAANPDLGEAVEEVGCEYEADDVKLGMNPDYLTDFLSVVETDRIRLAIKDENTQAVGYPVDGPDDRYLCVIMPMRI